MKNPFYKYPECEPMTEGPYLCVCVNRTGKHFYQSLYWNGKKFNGPFDVVSFTNLSPYDAAQFAQI